MKKIYIIAVMASLALLTGCTSANEKTTTDATTQQSTIETSTETESVEKPTMKNSIKTPSDFRKVTSSELEQIPDVELLEPLINNALDEIGVNEVTGIAYGNYKSITTDIKDIEAYIVSDKANLIAKLERLNKNWSIIIINDYDSGAMYYPTSGKNAVSYATGELINPESTDSTEVDIQDYKSSRMEDLTVNGENITDICRNDMIQWKDHISDIQISTDSDKIYITILVSNGTAETTAKDEAQDTVRYLASLACDANNFYSSPGSDDLGSLYKKYTLLIGITEDGENIIYQGTTSSQNTMFWSK